MMTAEVIEKFEQKTATIGIVGLGYVGLPLALRYSDIGYRVLGFDIHAGKVARLNAGKTLIEHIPSSAIAAACAAGLSATTDFARAGAVDALHLDASGIAACRERGCKYG